ncbi:low temperature requirement protein A [Paenibacillus sp. LMG 31456]|uniref:Low temperature requirement protein A n=1 Tax=Paenibacillus foliorum TaxID=2654974 RepID=A0A972GTM2_9BACL|nr:low temperature requirement protein A [Paenibacillus foliorum]NOU92520.1 low temperature requirement protein A [Paenibacillus foliorum]
MAEKKVTWLELFYDLIFVAAVATTTYVLLQVEAGHIPFEYLFKYVLMFIPVWWSWVGQTMFINRFGQDILNQRIYMIVQMVFVLIMTSSLSANFDPYYYAFLIGYIGLRSLTAIQYLVVRKRETGDRRSVAHYLGTRFWIGILLSACSIFFDSWLRYIVLYIGIFVDILMPVFGRKYLIKMPTNTAHLLERFASLTLILFGELIVSTLSVLQPQQGDWNSILFSVTSFILIMSMWWQYFDNMEKKVNKSVKTVGHAIIYGHLFILMSLSMIAASIKLIFLHDISYFFGLTFIYGSSFLYFIATTITFHQYRYEQHKLKTYHFFLLSGLLASLFAFSLIVTVPDLVLVGELALFFIIYAKITTT